MALNEVGNNSKQWPYIFQGSATFESVDVQILIEVSSTTPTASVDDPLDFFCSITLAIELDASGVQHSLPPRCVRLGVLVADGQRTYVSLNIPTIDGPLQVGKGDRMEVTLNTDYLASTMDGSFALVIGDLLEPSSLNLR